MPLLLPSAGASEPLSRQLTIAIGLTVVTLMGFGYAVSLYRTVLFEQMLSRMRAENQAIAARIEHGYRELEQINTPAFRDRYAKA